MNFLTLEGGYIVIALFFLVITAFVTTRPFVSKNAFKKAMPIVFIVMLLAIMLHYVNTTNRMEHIKDRFNHGDNILCENKNVMKTSNTVLVRKNDGWKLENGQFSSPNFERAFHSARCVVDRKN